MQNSSNLNTAAPTFAFGDRVRHTRRPEWGIGTVTSAAPLTHNGKRAQRLTIRFANAGLKTITCANGLLERLAEQEAVPQHSAQDHAPGNGVADDDDHPIDIWSHAREESWLSSVAKQKVEEHMTCLPEPVRDPFRRLEDRLISTFSLYRFDSSGRGLIDWAVAQSGLEDPLNRFARQELEVLFDRWAAGRDEHLRTLLQDARKSNVNVQAIVARLPDSIRNSVASILKRR